jgi:protein-disulfide isomerase
MRKIVLLALLGAALSQPATGQLPSPVARVGGVEISSEDLDRRVGDRDLKARTEEYSVRAMALAQLIDAAVLADEAKKRGISVQDLLKAEVESRVSTPTADDARIAYEATHPTAKVPPSDEDLNQLAETLRLRRVATTARAYIEELRRQRAIEILLSPPRASRSAEAVGPSQGRPGAPVTIVEFSDFQCPHCGGAEKTIASLKATYGDKLRFVFRNFPLAPHSNAQAAAEAAMCADRQGRFWEMHDRLFANQSALAASDLLKYAAELGLDTATFQRCMTGHETAEAIAKDRLAAAGLSISGTPAFLVNGRLLTGEVPLAQFTQIVDQELRATVKKDAEAFSIRPIQ